MGEKGSVCVTGAGTYVASWVVKVLLSKGYIVHGTVRDPDEEGKNGHLKTLEKSENLLLFKADPMEYEGLFRAIYGCQGVFHAASPLPSIEPKDFQKEMIDPAVMGTLNVLKASHEARIKRVVLMSSMAAIMINPNWPKGKPMDETSWSEITSCNTVQDWYCLSKTMGEREAWEYAGKTGVELVTVCPPLVLGPMLQKTINASTTYFIELLKDVQRIENQVQPFVDVRDVAEALLLAYESPETSGRYICVAHSPKCRDLFEMLKSRYPTYNYPTQFIDAEDRAFTSEKLKSLGWKFRPVEESIVDFVQSLQEAGLLSAMQRER